MRSIVGWIAMVVAVGGAWLLVQRSTPPSPGTESGAAATPPADATPIASGAVSTADATAPARDDVRTLIADPLPSLDDFAPEQRAAVREILAQSQPDPRQIAEVQAAIAAVDEDDTARRTFLAMLERELQLGSAAIVRCDVLAVTKHSVRVRFGTSATEVGAEAGGQQFLTLGVSREQAAILARHGLATPAVVERGRVQTLLVARNPAVVYLGGVCVVAGPPRGEVEVAESPSPALVGDALEQQILDFEPAARDAVRELVAGSWPFLGLHDGACALVRCKIEHGWGGRRYRSLVDVPEVGIGVGDRIEASDYLLSEVQRHYGLQDAAPLQPGEVRTLVVYSVEPFGFRLYKRWVLIASPPLPK